MNDGTSGTGPPPARTRVPVRIVAPDADTYEGLAGFYRKLWDPDATAAGVEASLVQAGERNPAQPGVIPPTLLFLRGDEVIGYVGTIPVKLALGRGEAVAHFVKGLAILPEHRNGPAAFLLLKEITSRLPLAMCMTAGAMLRGMFTKAGYTEVGALTNHLRVLSPGQVLERMDPGALGLGIEGPRKMVLDVIRSAAVRPLAAAGGRLALAAWSLPSGGGAAARQVEAGTVDPGELDDLWSRSRAAIEAGPFRDAAHLVPRYLNPSGPYRALEVRRNGRLEGMAFLRRPGEGGDPRLKGIRVAALSDLVVPPGSSALLSLLRGAEKAAADEGAHALLLTASHRAVGRAGIRRGYVPLPGNVYAFVRDASGSLTFPDSVGQWWLTRGDSHADEVF